MNQGFPSLSGGSLKIARTVLSNQFFECSILENKRLQYSEQGLKGGGIGT